MIRQYLFVFPILLILVLPGCGYRFVQPYQASEYALVTVKNATVEAGLGDLLEEELRKLGGFKENSPRKLSVTVTDFDETADSINSMGAPVRQRLDMEVSWKIEEPGNPNPTFGKELVNRTYLNSNDTTTLDWNRSAAVSLLAESAARKLLERLEEQP